MSTTFNILVVDDELGMRMGVERTLRNHVCHLKEFKEEVKYKITMVDCGNAALEQLSQNPYDLMILDHKLPDVQGLEILGKIKKEKCDVLTIMITAFASLEVAISATKSGAFDFLAKPFTPDELKERVDKATKHLFLKQRAKQLEAEKKQVRFQFISVLAHELKAPLAAIEGYLHIMNSKVAGDSIDKYENMITRSKTRIDGMRKMIMDLLDLTRIESGNKKRTISKISMSQVANECLESVMLEAQTRNISIELNDSPEVFMDADVDEMRIVFNNLITNAVKYNKDDGKVDLTIKESGSEVTIICADTGIGMSTEEQEKLFGEFSRIKNKKTRDIMGSGLGLSILKKIVDQYDGTINVSSESDKGTTFTVTLKKE